MLPLLHLLAFGAVVGVRVTVVGDLDEAQRSAFVAELGAGLHGEGHRAVVGEPACVDPANCVAAFREELGAEEVILIEILAGASTIRIDAGRALRGDREPSRRAEQSLARDRKGLQGVALSLVRSLYPKTEAPPPTVAFTPPPPRLEKPLPIAPIALFGVGAGLTTAAIILGVNSQAHFDRVETEPLSSVDNRDLYDQAGTEATVATVLFSAAAGAVIAGVIWWALD